MIRKRPATGQELADFGQKRARLLTKEAEDLQKRLGSILKTAARFNPSNEFDVHRISSRFSEPKPTAPSIKFSEPTPVAPSSEFSRPKPTAPKIPKLPRKPRDPYVEPDPNNKAYKPSLHLFDKLFTRRKTAKLEQARRQFEEDHRKWRDRREELVSEWGQKCEKISRKADERQAKYEAALKVWEERRRQKEEEQRMAYEATLKVWEERRRQKAEEQRMAYEAALKDWEERRQQYQSEKRDHNRKLSTLQKNYTKTEQRLTEYFEFCIKCFLEKVPLKVPNTKQFPAISLSYNSELEILIVEIHLPTPDGFPVLRQVKYIKIRNEFKEIELSQNEKNRLYDETIYQLAIALIAVVFKADVSKAVAMVVFNGRVRFHDEATGRLADACIISLQSDRGEFRGLSLEHVDAETCFRKLKGIGSGKLFGLVPVAPLLELDKKDDRFVAARPVKSDLEVGENIAAMDWEEFEHLVREVFQAEFGQGGGEVKITRASRDRGVDAIAFDPDPIRGGKIVIQAKRYTNLVGVDAVRDLYGTVVAEGANIGILVTTSKYGPDAYGFAKGKPLRLLDGSNLLHLLESHGYRARIDLREAKQILAERENSKL